jgi:hypothetical protein
MLTSTNIPDTVYLYRIIHIDNLAFILDEHELRCANHSSRDPNYIGIGDSTLIQKRGSKNIFLSPGGTFKDYVAFYFGHRSPMLYEIKHGYNDVTKRSQEDIIYLIATVESVKQQDCRYVFFDGHAYHSFSSCYNNLDDLSKIHWNNVYAQVWRDTETNPDRKRRKQAEFMIYDALPWETIVGIGVYNSIAQHKVENFLNSRNIFCNVKIKANYYY